MKTHYLQTEMYYDDQQMHEVLGTRVEVYFNLHKLVWSVRKPHGKVLFHSDCVGLEDVQWVVQESGRQRVIKERKKNVHAFARGYLTSERIRASTHGLIYGVMYNPYKYDTFVKIKGDDVEPITHSDNALFYKSAVSCRGMVAAI